MRNHFRNPFANSAFESTGTESGEFWSRGFRFSLKSFDGSRKALQLKLQRERPFDVFWSSGLWWSFVMVVTWSLVVFDVYYYYGF